MILGIGIDSVEVARFAHWHTYQHKALLRIFSQQEIAYCLSNSAFCAQRFAVRFAAREALYKAISHSMPSSTIPLLTLCAATAIIKLENSIRLKVNWNLLKKYQINQSLFDAKIFVSVTHTKQYATAFVIIEQ